jgi:hypothetical protein
MMLQKCTNTLVFSLWLKNWPRDLVMLAPKVLLSSDDVDPPRECAYWFSFSAHLPSVWITLIYPRTSLYDWNCQSLIGHNILYDGLHLPFNFWSRMVIPTYRLASSCDCGSLSLKPTELTLVWQTCGHSSFCHPWNLWHTSSIWSTSFLSSFDPSRGTPSCHSSSMTLLSQSLWWWVPPCLSLDPAPLCLVWLLLAWRDIVTNPSKPSHDLRAVP